VIEMETSLPELVVLRFVGGVLIDQPFATAAWPMWAGTLERDTNASGGWRRTVWPSGPAGRGWEIATLHVGDVIEFGSHAKPTQRWFGYHAHYSEENGALVACGPFPTPEAADEAGQTLRADLDSRALDDFRRAQLANALADAPGRSVVDG
jgi:hypothetical protein